MSETDDTSKPEDKPPDEPVEMDLQTDEPDRRGRWLRLLLVVLFWLIYQISEVVFGAVAVFQVITMLLTGDRNERLNEFSGRLTLYMYKVLQYICLRSDEQPWPLGEPVGEPGDDE